MPELMTPAAYARRRKVSRSAVSKAIRKGRISTVTDTSGRKLIDPAVADIQWSINTDPLQAARANAPKGEYGLRSEGEGGKAFWDARVLREQSEAAMAVMRRREMENDLVERSRVELAAARINGAVRETLLGVPPIIAPSLARETCPHQVELLLTDALRRALAGLASMTAGDLAE